MGTYTADHNGLKIRTRLAGTHVKKAPLSIAMKPATISWGVQNAGWFVYDDVVYIGTKKHREVSYQIVGWDKERKMLLLNRILDEE